VKAFVTGAAGMLGTSLLPVLREHEHTIAATDIRFLDDDMGKLDVRNFEEMSRVISDFGPDILYHLAAETNLETCEEQVDYAYETNFVGTQNACMVCRNLGIPLVYVSTAGVFDGTKLEPYTEFDNPNPINVYGSSKLEGEKIVREILPEHYVVRAGWMIGGADRDRKFVHKIMDQLDNGTKTIHAVTDRTGTPTYAPAFSRVLEKLIRTGRYGTYHLACKGRASRFEVAREMLRILNRSDVSIKPVTSDFFKEEFFAPRPRSEEMRNYVLDLISMNDMPHWGESLNTYLQTFFADRFH